MVNLIKESAAIAVVERLRDEYQRWYDEIVGKSVRSIEAHRIAKVDAANEILTALRALPPEAIRKATQDALALIESLDNRDVRLTGNELALYRSRRQAVIKQLKKVLNTKHAPERETETRT